MDQAVFTGQRVTQRREVMQVVWVYEHPIDFDGLRRFHQNLRRGLLGRRIERSPLPFARDRWVSDPGPSDIDIATCARPRSELSEWADECLQLPLDPEMGPSWHLNVLPLTDGSTAVSLLISHYVLDGLGMVAAVHDAIVGNTRDLAYPPPRSRTRLRAVGQDVRLTVRQVPELARAVVASVKLARTNRQDIAKSRASRAVAVRERRWDNVPDDVVLVPHVTVVVDVTQWDARAQALGGTSKTLVAGWVAKLAEHMGRRSSGDGTVTMQLPISTRSDGDTRANAVSFARVRIDSTQLTTDLRDARAAIRQALETVRKSPDESSQVASLIPFIPKRVLKRMGELDDTMFGDYLPVFCSNLGDFGSVVCRLDGSDAEYVTGRLAGQHLTRQWLERIDGLMTVQSWRLPDRIFVAVCAYQPGSVKTKTDLRELAARTLSDFNLTGEID
ncbi:wax ester/triacylglycerol synthase family O-acyltransferase [Mycobacterium sp. 1164966.3]|uniref:wax ester/triacylglycerol synthase family O-acyltransferase n=1 Tax=Mycobacterium sp. 1164966.3 TaxID=1856861 RepID=UPI0020A5BC7B|nr:wax ester/triacylglycerol synthase family O-acyltransferase [Mycobacterium sp. 1164966.3]